MAEFGRTIRITQQDSTRERDPISIDGETSVQVVYESAVTELQILDFAPALQRLEIVAPARSNDRGSVAVALADGGNLKEFSVVGDATAPLCEVILAEARDISNTERWDKSQIENLRLAPNAHLILLDVNHRANYESQVYKAKNVTLDTNSSFRGVGFPSNRGGLLIDGFSFSWLVW